MKIDLTSLQHHIPCRKKIISGRYTGKRIENITLTNQEALSNNKNFQSEPKLDYTYMLAASFIFSFSE